MDIYGMQGALNNVTLRQVNLTENIICTKLTFILLRNCVTEIKRDMDN